MTRMLGPTRLLTAAGFALLCLVLALGYASAQSIPAAPAIASVSSGDTTLTVAWTAPAGETGITAYDVRHIETSADETVDANWTVEDNAWTSGTLEYIITMLDNGTEYDVQVRAVNSNGDGTWSATEVGTPALPAPAVDSVRADDRAVLVSWSAPTGITTGVAAYDVRYIETSADETVDSDWTVEEDAWEDGGGSLTYAITGLTNGTEYDVQVRTVDVDDVDGAWSVTTSATPADHGNTRTAATSVTAGARVSGAIDPADDEDYFSFSVSGTADYWIYSLGDLDTVGELLDSGGMSIDISDRGDSLPNPDNFFLWRRLQSGTYYIKVTGYGSTDEPYVLRIREFRDTTSRSNAATLNLNGSASGTIDPEDDEDYFKLELSETTEVAIRTSGFPDTVGELQRSNGTVIASNDDGYLPGGKTNFLIRESLNAGVYYVKVSSFASSSDGPYTVYATAITEPGSAIADAQPLTLGGTAGGIIDPAGDEDYFSLTLEETTYVIIGGVSHVTNISGGLTDENDLRAPVDSIHFDGLFIFEGRLDAGTYYLKVTGKDATETGRYTVRAIVESSYTYFVNRCSNIPTSSSINDPLYGCQWHLKNNDQFRSGGHDIRVEEVWPTYTGSGINVAVVDDGMHYRHEDLTDNVLASFNHNYDPDQTDIYHPFEDHGTAVAGLIAAKDNSLGMRGVAPEAKIYGYNYLVEDTVANEADAMSRNSATTAISNNSWGPGDSGRPEPATELWETAVKNGVTTGYGGKGVFYAWAAGNGGDYGDYSTLDEYSNFYAVTAVCAVGHDDKRSEYSEAGANLWVCGPSSSGRAGQPRIATTDNGHRYRGTFGGTSAATPIVSGVVALVREANSALTWRDIKLILAASARKNDPDNAGWLEGAFKYGSTTDRYNFNHEYGFGMVDAKAAVDLAPGWTNVRDLREITSESGVINLRIPDLPSSGTPTTVTTNLNVDPFVEFVEFVEVNAHFSHISFRDLTVELVSPSGAVSTLSPSAPVRFGWLTTEFRFGSARHLGVGPAGEWTLRIKDLDRGIRGMLMSWGITIYGHGSIPGAPDIDNVTPGGGTLEIDWKAPTDTGETAITSYDLRYIRNDATDKSDDNWSVETGVGTPSSRRYTITGLRGGVKYAFQLRAHNDSGHGPWSQAEIIITDEVNEPPVVTGNDDLEFQENRTGSITRYTATDPERDSFEWSVTGVDGSFFSIDSRGYLTFNDPPDFEASRSNTYDLTVVATDTEGNAGELEVMVTVIDVNEPPTVTGDTVLSIDENTAPFSRTYFASDAEGTATTFTWSVSATDSGDFNINRDTGELTFRNTPDYENPADSNRNNEYLVTVVATDQGNLRGNLPVTVTVNDVNEPPTITGDTSKSYPENSVRPVATYRATDPERGTITWSVSGTDDDDFAISETGVLTFTNIPDFEMPADADQDNEYLVTVEARDDGSNTATLDVTVTVTNSTGAEEPTITTTGTPSPYRENRTGAVYTFRARDPQGRPVSWSVTGTDSHAFQISSSGVLTFRGPPDFENPTDSDRDNNYEIRVVVTDDQSLTDSVAFTVTVTNDAEGAEPTISTRSPPATYRENGTSAVYTFRATDPQRQVIAWTLDGADQGDFTITRDSSGRGVLAFSTPPDFEVPADADRQNDYELTIIADDEDGHTDRLSFTITVTDVNEGPEITRVGSAPGSVVETYDPTQVLARYTATDPEDTSAVITLWSISGTDGGDFVMNEQGELRFRNQPDHERPADSNRDNMYVFTVRASDGRYYGTFDETVTVENVNEPPTITTTGSSATALRQNENRTTRLYSYRATDPEGETITWSVGGVDGRFFAISKRGEFSFRETSPPDYERPGDSGGDNVYSATVRAQDSGGITAELEIAVTVTPVNEGPEVTGGQSAFTISENQDLPGAAYTAFDPEGGTVTRWSLGGRDGGDFTISSGGLLTFRNLPDYERPADSNRDNLYELQVRPYDGRYYGAFAVTVTVNDINEPPEIRSGSQTSFTQNENQTSRLYTYSATDPERATITWSVGGVDGRFFAIDERGQFSFSESSPPDFEQPGDSGSDNVYEATIQVRDDGGNTASLPVTVTVREVNEGPEVSGPSTFTIAENRGLPGAVYTATDPEGAYVTRWRLGGRDGGDFFITQGGTLYFRSPPDYERPADSNRDNVYEVSIQPADGRNTGSYPVTVTVTDVNEPPEIRRGSTTLFTQPENRTSRLYTYSATDPERGMVAWSVGGTDGNLFIIDERGQFSFREDNPPDFDAPGDVGRDNLYYVTVQATDPEFNTASLSVIVRVTEVNEGPVITRQGSAPGSVSENHAVTQALAGYTASDPERPSVRITRWSTSGRDGGDFVMNALGELRFRNSPDFERPADANRDNVYEVTIRASDGRNTGTLEEVQVVTVTDVNEPPTITTTSRTAFSQPENRTSTLYTFRATDPEGNTVTWTPAGTDGSSFTIDERGGFSFSDPPDFDNPRDAGRNNVYDVTVQARDEAFNTASLQVTVTVTDHNENVEPTITTRRPPSTYRENGTGAVYTFRASDPQRGTTITWSLTGTDAGAFTITRDSSGRGVLAFASSPDFESPADANRDNEYELAVVATDEEGYADRVDFTITVTNDNEGVEPTISTRRPPSTYRENGTSAVYTFRASDPQRDPITWSLQGTDAGDFSIIRDSSGRGVLAFARPPDFESPADINRDNRYELAVVATDDGGNADRLDFTITVTDINEGPEIMLEGTAVTSVPENYADTQVLARYTARDPENPGAGIYQWSTTGRDGGDFVISALGELRFRSSPDHERPADADRDNVYEVTVRAYDGRVYGMLEEPLMLTVTEVNEAPVITTRSRTEFTVRENSTLVLYTYRATDQDQNNRIRWSVEGTDGRAFAIYNGMLTFRRLPNLELPVDSNQDNTYEITVVAADSGGLRDTVNAAITVTDQLEGPVIAGTTSFTVAENYDITQVLGSYTATDARDMRTVHPQWSLSGRDGGDFVIDRYSGALTFRNTPDYDRPADSDRDNVYEVTVRAHDSVAYGYLNVTVTVNNINEGAPVVTGRTSQTVRENTTSAIYTYRATDPDLADPIAWSTGGTDGHLFRMSDRGELSFRQAPDYDIPRDSGGINEYSIEVVATDSGGLRGILAVTITVTNLNEGPTVSGPANFTIDENQVLPSSARYTATDPDTLTPATITWRVSGRDGGDFTIDRETGVLAFRITPNYERPADSNRDSVYEVTVRAYDGRNYGDFDVTVMVLAVNEGPEITGRDAFTYRENGTAALYTYRATDPEGNDFTWHLGGLDASDFGISDRGVLTFALPPNFDSPTGSGTDRNQYLVTVQARDDQGNTGELPVTVTVTDQNEGPTVSGRTEISVQENLDTTSILATYSAADPEGQTITRWSLSGRDGGGFRISENGELTFRNIPDYDLPADSNRDNVYLVTVRAYDGRVYGSLDVTVTVRGENEAAPVVTGRNGLTVRENTSSTLSTYRASDADRNTVFTWSVQGVDGSAFMIDERGALTFSSPPNYEIPGDAGGNNVYAITIVATDDGGSQGTLDVTVTVTEVNEGPEITGATTYTVVEGQDLIGASFTARDPEDPSIEVVNWRTSGTDGGDFTISQDGVLTFRNTPDYDRPADSNRDNVYLVTVQVSDGRYYGSLEATVTVTDLNEAAPTVTGRETLSIRENTASTLYTYRASDMDRGATIIWSVGGTDGDDFEISEQGALTFASPPDYERPADSDGDNVYEITIRASDGSSAGELGVTITVTAVNEGPEISGRTSMIVFENHEAILATYSGTDPEDVSAEITRWSVAGRDGGDFTINSDGELTFRYPPNYERPADANRDNEYEVTVRASDGRVYGTYDVTVTVEAVDEAPEFRRGSRDTFTYRENGTSALYTYRATDPEGADVSWSVSGTDGEDFEIGASGVLEFRDPPDFDDPADDDEDNEYELTVVATDQTGHAANLPVTVTVTDVNEGPIISGASEFAVRENHDAALGTYTARDPEISDLDITRWSVTGRDGGDFTIDEDGELTFRNPPDYERPADSNRDSIYEVTVRASDGRYYGTFDVTVTVEAVDEAPEFRSVSEDTFSYKENGTAAVATYRATDPEGSDVTWGLSGTDSTAFAISEMGVLTFLNAPDYEDPADSDDDNVYEVTVEARDENANTARLRVTVTVVNLTD